MWRGALFTIAVVSIASACPGTAAAGQPAESTISGAELVARIEAAEGGDLDVDVTGLTVTGPVDLTTLRDIDRPLRCLSCTFEGPISAADVVFTSIVELVDATFKGAVDARGAIFQRSSVFDGASFNDGLNLAGAQFDALASFVGTDIAGTANFDRAVLGGRAVFTGSPLDAGAGVGGPCAATQGAFAGRASFRGSSFRDAALFRQRCFADSATFEGASFAAAADFTLSTHHGATSFERVAFGADGSFNIARFIGPVSFVAASLAGKLDFDRAEFGSDATFSSLSGSGSLVLDGIIVPEGADRPLRLASVTLDGLAMELDRVRFIRGPTVQREVLELLESTARARGDTGVANNAHFELLTRRNGTLPQPRRFLDRAFYGDVAGYLVRPIHPLICLAVLAMLGTVVRALPTWRRALTARRRPAAILTHLSVGLFGGISDTLSASWSVRKRPEPHIELQPQVDAAIGPYMIAGLRWAEWLAVKLLIAVALLGIANANPTIRSLVDAVL